MTTALRQAAGPVRVPTWSITDRLRKAREDAGLDQSALAERAGISRATVSNAERGVGVPNTATLRVWSLATGVPLVWLLEGDMPPTEPIQIVTPADASAAGR